MKQNPSPFTLLVLVGLLAATAPVARGGELDANYVKQFGHAMVLASGKGLPQKGQYNPEQFDVREKVFFVPAGDGSSINFRAILPEGQTYGKYIEDLKKSKSAEAASFESGVSAWWFWVSHDLEGKAETQPWPSKPGELPGWKHALFFSSDLNSDQLAYNTIGLTWEQVIQSSKLGEWLKQAKPGYKLFIAHSTGFSFSGGAGTPPTSVSAPASEAVHDHVAEGLALLPPSLTCTIQVSEQVSEKK